MGLGEGVKRGLEASGRMQSRPKREKDPAKSLTWCCACKANPRDVPGLNPPTGASSCSWSLKVRTSVQCLG